MSTATPSVKRTRYVIFFEENGGLTTANAGREWSMGNGDIGSLTTQTGIGMPYAGRVYAMSFQGTSNSPFPAQVTLEVNLVLTAATVDIAGGSAVGISQNNLITPFVPVTFNAGDELGVATTFGAGSPGGNRIAVFIEET